ncbi:MAG: aldehyde dehydrogenase family protein [Alkalilacustris sp.]
MLENLSELLITHHVGGAWRAPLSQRMHDVRLHGALAGRLVEAEEADVRRALDHARRMPAAPQPDHLAQRFLDAWAARAGWAEAARRREGFSGGLAPQIPGLSGSGPLALLGSVITTPGLMAGAVAAGLRAGRPILLKPAPRAPFTALVLAEALAEAGAPPGAFALLQGGGAVTGTALRTLLGTGDLRLLGKPARAGLGPVESLG